MFKDFITEFHENIEGLREFVELIGPFLDEHQAKVRKSQSKTLLPLQLAVLKHSIVDESKNPEVYEEIDTLLKESFDGEIEVETNSDGESDSPKSFLLKINSDKKSDINYAIKEIEKSEGLKTRLYRSSLLSLLSTVEWFYSQILHYYYDQHPESAGISGKTLTLDELKSFENVKEAEKFLIEDKIEKILRKSFSDWMDILKAELSLNMGYLDNFKSELIEIYLRRNLIVHNGGRVNSTYLSKVDNQFSKDITLEKQLNVTIDYLENAIDKLHLTFTLIACELWKKKEPENEVRGLLLMKMGYKYLTKGNWTIGEFTNTFMCRDKKQPGVYKTVGQLNYWLCMKRKGMLKKVEKQLNEADFSDKALKFQLALYSLREDEDRFFSILQQALDKNEISEEELLEFPIFDEMKNSERFSEFFNIEEIEINEELTKSD